MFTINNIKAEKADQVLKITHRNHGHSIDPSTDGCVNIIFESEWDSKVFKAAHNYIHPIKI